jgi:hypothetical protein
MSQTSYLSRCLLEVTPCQEIARRNAKARPSFAFVVENSTQRSCGLETFPLEPPVLPSSHTYHCGCRQLQHVSGNDAVHDLKKSRLYGGSVVMH